MAKCLGSDSHPDPEQIAASDDSDPNVRFPGVVVVVGDMTVFDRLTSGSLRCRDDDLTVVSSFVCGMGPVAEGTVYDPKSSCLSAPRRHVVGVQSHKHHATADMPRRVPVRRVAAVVGSESMIEVAAVVGSESMIEVAAVVLELLSAGLLEVVGP